MASTAVEENTPDIKDWSMVHKATERLARTPKESADWAQFKLTTEQIKSFWENGYILNVPVLTEQQCDDVVEDCKYFTDDANRHPGHDLLYEYHSNQTGDPNNVLIHVLGHWRLTELFHELVFLPQVVVPVSQLLSEDRELKRVRFWHDQLFAKPPHHGGNVAWHQDYSYWIRTKPMMHLTVHIALDEQKEENGALHYIPGSHRWTRNGGMPLPVTDFNFKDMESIKTILTEEEKDNFEPVCGNLKKGHASFHHALAVHGSYGNRSDHPRRAAVLNYFADGVCSDTNEEMLKGSHVPKGCKMEGQLYPVVFEPESL